MGFISSLRNFKIFSNFQDRKEEKILDNYDVVDQFIESFKENLRKISSKPIGSNQTHIYASSEPSTSARSYQDISLDIEDPDFYFRLHETKKYLIFLKTVIENGSKLSNDQKKDIQGLSLDCALYLLDKITCLIKSFSELKDKIERTPEEAREQMRTCLHEAIEEVIKKSACKFLIKIEKEEDFNQIPQRLLEILTPLKEKAENLLQQEFSFCFISEKFIPEDIIITELSDDQEEVERPVEKTVSQKSHGSIFSKKTYLLLSVIAIIPLSFLFIFAILIILSTFSFIFAILISSLLYFISVILIAALYMKLYQ